MKQICLLLCLQTFTSKIYFLVLITCVAQQAFAQFQDDFSDNDFIHNPSWLGQDSLFKIDPEGRLQLDAPAQSGVAYLSTVVAASGETSWEFNIDLDFNPSGTNYARIYLAADQPDLTGPLDGYFIMVGSSDDDVCLYHQTGTRSAKLIDGRDGILNASAPSVSIHVSRNDQGWQLFTKQDTTVVYMPEGTANDTATFRSAYFGILCVYTATRSDKFFFDDFNIKSATHDETPPAMRKLEVLSSTEVRLTFSEPLDPTSATFTENFTIDNNVGTPVAATLQGKQLIHLTFAKSLPSNTEVFLSIADIKDMAGNIMDAAITSVVYIPSIEAGQKDIIITEIFSDPSPSVGLPAFEFVELYNRSKNPFNLSGWTLSDGSSGAPLSDFVIFPNEYVVLTSSDADFHGLANLVKLTNFPTLNNATDFVILKDNTGQVIDSVRYFLSWFNDDEKAQGGYSLEIIDPNNICAAQQNWSASEHERGGTPGFQNSVFANNPDNSGPVVLSAIPISATVLQVHFNEKLENKLPTLNAVFINPALAVVDVSFSDASLHTLQLNLGNTIQVGMTYTLTLENIYDCSGNIIQPDKAKAEFGLPEPADSLDVLINEILFNPRPTGVDFIEIINNTKKFIDLKGWSIATFTEGSLKKKTVLSSENLLFKPGAILAITKDPDVLKGEYIQAQEVNFHTLDDLPALNDDEGSIALMDPHNDIIDYFTYSKDMHSIFIKNDEGVSLERISALPAPMKENWTSASSAVGFATPGYANSAALTQTVIDPTSIKVQPEIFNPVGSPPNFAIISYQADRSGCIGNVRILSPHGYVVKEIANNDILGTSGFYRWEGDREDGTKANVGYYMVLFEVFNADGSVKRYQQRVAIAATF